MLSQLEDYADAAAMMEEYKYIISAPSRAITTTVLCACVPWLPQGGGGGGAEGGSGRGGSMERGIGGPTTMADKEADDAELALAAQAASGTRTLRHSLQISTEDAAASATREATASQRLGGTTQRLNMGGERAKGTDDRDSLAAQTFAMPGQNDDVSVRAVPSVAMRAAGKIVEKIDDFRRANRAKRSKALDGNVGHGAGEPGSGLDASSMVGGSAAGGGRGGRGGKALRWRRAC